MAAWLHTSSWNDQTYAAYRKFVRGKGSEYKGHRADCADLCKIVLIDFAALNGLPLTFIDGAGRWYKSPGRHASESLKGLASDIIHWRDTAQWTNKEEYIQAVSAVSADALFKHNTEAYPDWPDSGDLMIKSDHAALVLARHEVPKSRPDDVPLFPGSDEAVKQVDVTLYYRCDPDRRQKILSQQHLSEEYLKASDCGSSEKGYVDYLNHRGNGKESAELIYNANVDQMLKDGFQFRKWAAFVLRSWTEEELKCNSSGPACGLEAAPNWRP